MSILSPGSCAHEIKSSFPNSFPNCYSYITDNK